MSTTLIQPVIRTMQRELIVCGWHPTERVDISIKNNYDTACWSFLPSRKHRIYVGNNVTRRMRPELSLAQQAHYIGSYVCHEYSHAWHTERDLAATKIMLAEITCSFDLLNLFEDARIEQRWRDFTARPFLWAELEMIDPTLALEAAGVFFLFIQGEGVIPHGISVPDADMLAEVEDFYRKSCAIPDTLALQNLLAAWIDHFGVSVPPNTRFLGGDKGELALGLQLQSDAVFQSEFDAGTSDEGRHVESRPEDEEIMVAINLHIEDGLLSREEAEIDERETAKSALRFEPLFRDKTRAYFSEESGKHISAVHFAIGRPCYRHRTEANVLTRKIGLVMDCSGSMDGEPIRVGRELIATLNLLARQGRVQGALVLSGVTDDTALSESFPWPIKDEIIRRIHAFGEAEGLQTAITTHAATLSGCDQVFVFTDGHITDEPLRLSPLRSRGIFVCGLYVGRDPHMADYMQRHFDHFYLRETLNGLIDALLSVSAKKRP